MMVPISHLIADHMREGVLPGRYDENTIYEIVDYYRKAINMTEEKQVC